MKYQFLSKLYQVQFTYGSFTVDILISSNITNSTGKVYSGYWGLMKHVLAALKAVAVTYDHIHRFELNASGEVPVNSTALNGIIKIEFVVLNSPY